MFETLATDLHQHRLIDAARLHAFQQLLHRLLASGRELV